ncbi:ankyrin repeat-containing protein NPR4-like [Cryptomeria japonica]|uniref:ankyrin repeat-containing protein NPR4-like n=1 Tax=Cryptomeria japonica TaxID=3369 RepID=UPI0027DA7EF2|nr:ankyrin repeat-containing protein NPR4-like [Cryptomeria japonica]
MGLESCDGRELFDQISRKGCLSKDEARFYSAEIVDSLEYLHKIGPLVRYLVSFQGANVNALDINALNDEDKTALDIASAAAPHNPNCDSIKQILENAGGIRWSFIPNSNITSDPSNEPEQGEDKDIVDTHMVVASLIATVTFAAIFQIPGGIDDNINSEHYEAAKMAFRRLFRFFIFSDTAAFTSSLTVVVAWVVKQLLGDTYSGRQTALSRLSGITLIVSILWTIAAFVSASVIVIVPPHHEKLKSKDKKAFAKFQSLWQLELALGFLVPFGIGSMLVLSNIRFLSARLSFKVFLCYIYIELFLIMSIIIDSTFQLT